MQNSRASHFKSRAGCRTCKRRRIKCDEIKPCCIRCLSGNRICEGYGIVIDAPKRPTSKIIKIQKAKGHANSWSEIQPKVMTTLDVIPFLNHSESAAFDLFRSQTIREMSGLRSSNFWKKIALPACYSVPAILHASMALASAGRWSQASRKGYHPLGSDLMKLDTVHYYNKAIQHLKIHVAKHGDLSSLKISLIACILFIALELSTGRFGQALMHLNQGRKLLHTTSSSKLSAKCDSKVSTKTARLLSSFHSTEDEIVSVFADLDLQATYFGSERPQLTLGSHSSAEIHGPKSQFSLALPKHFSFMQEANQYLVIITNKCLQFVGQELDHDQHTRQNESSNFHRQYLYKTLKDWRKRYKEICSKAVVSDSSDTWKQYSSLMCLHHTWLSIVLPTSYAETEETDFDSYFREFATIVDLANSILSEDASKRLSLEFGLVAPLSWTVKNCRHPQIRRKALHLLTQAGREGLWEPRLMTQLGRELILLEEGIEKLEYLDLHAERSYGDEDLVPLERRISTVSVSLEIGEHPELCITFQRKAWSYGQCIGMETIIRRQPYESLLPEE
ncbi:uncharacterized protein LY89DRAFT_612974 [Mollisia scopiformis]|uniref:Zn(2)-C6 fungal-type domain-containing protein n=1 Tax=Mollisia scopiformis TaxID=149040 RepID=A0A194XGT4_MOLSC|nr:uncharacterized protein LY89DRAFT_612974 [Mollisia scopiformis]KUJ19351.1 hypothetical protein LY89DRAFT_612974 [Mollisia scopiformis]